MLTVSNYHYIRPHFEAKYPSIFGITPAVFENQLKVLKNEGDFIHPKDLVADFHSIVSSKANYHFITFDDGLKEQWDYALPILDSLNIPAIFFANSINFDEEKVTTVHKIHLLRSILAPHFIVEKLSESDSNALSSEEKTRAQTIYRYDDSESAALKYLLNFKMSFKEQEVFIDDLFQSHYDEKSVLESLYMSKENLKQLAQNGYLGSHTHHHYPIGLLPKEAMEFELEHSKNYLETLTQTKIEMVSYPYGSPEACTEEVATLAKNCGYQLGFTTQRGSNVGTENRLLLNRFDCNDLPGGKSYVAP